jgi:predicted permease
MTSALGGVLSILLAIGAGFALAKRGWFEGGSSELVSRLVVALALPAYMVANLMGGYDRQKLLSLLPGVPIPFVAMLASYGLARILAWLCRIRRGRRGTFASMFALSNTIFVGLPVNLVLFGESSLPFVLLYYIANTSLFWTIGVHGIAADGAALAGGGPSRLFSLSSLKRMLSPPLLAFLASILAIILGIKLPAFFLDFCKTIGSMTTPLSMLFVGIVVARVDWKKVRLERDIALVAAGRFLASPLILVLIARQADLPLLMKQVFFVQAAMPAMTQTPILAIAYGADAEYAGLGTAITTVLSLATIPLCMALVGQAF